MEKYRKDFYWENNEYIVSSDNTVRLHVIDGAVWDTETAEFIGTMPDDWTIITEETGDILDVYPY